MTPYLTVAGTWGRDDGWHRYGSPWSLMMQSHGFLPLYCDEPPRPFTWTCDVNGVKFWKRWTKSSDDVDWRCGGENLFAYLVPPVRPDARVPPADVNIIAHSHGLQCVLYAASMGLKINSLIDVSGPVRDDMMLAAAAARPNIRYWAHIFDGGTRDRMQLLGAFGDGVFGIVRRHPLADVNALAHNAGHSGALNEPAHFDVWPALLAHIRADSAPTLTN